MAIAAIMFLIGLIGGHFSPRSILFDGFKTGGAVILGLGFLRFLIALVRSR